MINRKFLVVVSILLMSGCISQTTQNRSSKMVSEDTHDAVAEVTPAMAAYSERFIKKDLWNRPELSRRDRSLVTVAALISRNDTAELPHYLNVALDSGVKPTEISETITHLAFYAGWSNATSAALVARNVFAQRHIDTALLPGEKVDFLPLDKEAENKRATMVESNFGKVSPGVVKYTTDALFLDLWLRPGLAPRDRSLVTVSALVTAGQVAQIPYHLKRAMDNGLTQVQASEVLTQLAFVAGWPNIFSALPVFKDVFSGRNPA
ncbi:carboxymuconolactone decarboxylase family protein [Pectobacterium brasiliense]|uniref:Carboxymuconolactone decarboxylase family protein n=1 Tax=Pectobacterium brasiliense TaxID=180957 RepID=A0AAW9H8S4_9GAMM|nr:carboxymuconolactone decarboxylase family protein [Pectobacterium brasiliense]MDY4376829.1 carboxymuconolactone decarboxylase family protein [Pectobacterium brasiliense]